MELRDKSGRKINYLRLSITDRCNMRCVYCIPEEGIDFIPRDSIFSLEELAEVSARFIRIFDIDKIRLTGGEPLVRRNIDYLIRTLASEPKLKEITLTTNGALLASRAQALYEAGLRRVNVSLDSLNPERFRDITGGGNLSSVLKGLKKAAEVGFKPVKINTVLLPGFNEAREMVEWANREGYILRFIEFMPPSTITSRRIEGRGPKESDIVDELESAFGKSVLLESNNGDGGKIAHRFGFENNNMVFEVIPGTSEPFCGTCNRIRIDCQGVLRSCLYSTDTLSLRDLAESSDDEFAEAVLLFIRKKMGRTLDHIGTNMSAIGG